MNPSPYTEILLKHYKEPVNAGSVEGMEHIVEHRNRSCGDRVLLGVNVDARVITQIRHESDGCMLCRASASILCQYLDGRTVLEANELRTWVSKFCDLETSMDGLNIPELISLVNPGHVKDKSRNLDTAVENTTDFMALLEIRSFPTRIRCVTLPWEALDRILATEFS
jgi:nitrogen fixation protein NifU and related proteins